MKIVDSSSHMGITECSIVSEFIIEPYGESEGASMRNLTQPPSSSLLWDKHPFLGIDILLRSKPKRADIYDY